MDYKFKKAWDFGKNKDAGEYTTSNSSEPIPFSAEEVARLCAIEVEWNDWRKGKRGVSEHLALIEENKRLKAEIAEMRERERWIPVGEKQPNDMRIVAVQVKRGYVDYGYYRDWSDEWWTPDECGLLDVVAWKERPLPAMEKGAD